MTRCFSFYPFFGVDGSILISNDGSRTATEQDMERHFWRQAEIELDRLTLEMCAYHREHNKALEQWQLDAELAAFLRTRLRAATNA